MVTHSDSDHLNIRQVAVGNDKNSTNRCCSQCKCVGLKTIVALLVS